MPETSLRPPALALPTAVRSVSGSTVRWRDLSHGARDYAMICRNPRHYLASGGSEAPALGVLPRGAYIPTQTFPEWLSLCRRPAWW